MTPDTDDLDVPDRIARPSGRAILLGSVGVLLAGAAVAVAGFLAGGGNVARIAPQALILSTQSGQLGTFSLHDEKPMRAIGKGMPATTTPRPSTSATPSP